jgi:hypothetical protein
VGGRSVGIVRSRTQTRVFFNWIIEINSVRTEYWSLVCLLESLPLKVLDILYEFLKVYPEASNYQDNIKQNADTLQWIAFTL